MQKLKEMNSPNENVRSGRLNLIRSTSAIKASIIVMIIWFLSTGTIFSQMIDRTITLYPGGSHPDGTSIILPKVRLNQTFNFTVPLLVSPPYSASISFHEGTCGDITDNHTINNTDCSVTFVVTSKCPVGEDSFFNFKLCW